MAFAADNLDEWYIKQEILDNLKQLTILLEHNDIIKITLWWCLIMDKTLAEAAMELYTENLFEIVRQNYCDANKDYLQKQVQIALEYLTEEQKEELRSKGIQI